MSPVTIPSMPQPLKPFVLLHHVLPDGEHWDLCLDQGPSLATWQLLAHSLSEISQGRPAILARYIQDHRRVYLDYEGPISDDRGHVTRSDLGSYELLDQQTDRWVIRLAGCVVIGTYEIVATADSGSWKFYRT